MAACPIVASTRGGAVIVVGTLALAGLLFLARHQGVSGWRRWVPAGVALTAAGSGLYLGWAKLGPRARQTDIARPGLAEPLENPELRLRSGSVERRGTDRWSASRIARRRFNYRCVLRGVPGWCVGGDAVLKDYHELRPEALPLPTHMLAAKWK
jgi:hypothetical protein